MFHIGNLNIQLEMFYSSNSKVNKMGALFATRELEKQHLPSYYYALYTDNSIALFTPSKYRDNLASTIFPPPKSGEIRDIRFCKSTEQVLLHSSDGTLFIYQIQPDTSKLVRIVTGSDIKDGVGNGFKSQITCFELLDQPPP